MSTIEQFIKSTQLDVAVSTRAAASTALSNATWTDPLAAKLALTEKPPIAGSVMCSPFIYDSAAYTYSGLGFTGASTSSTTWVDAVNISGSGVLELCSQLGYNGTGTSYLEIIIDGVTVYSSSGTYSSAYPRVTCPVGQTTYPIVNAYIALIANGRLKFETSLQIRHKRDTAGSSYIYYKYQKWS